MKKARKNAKRKNLIQWLDKLVWRVTGRTHNFQVELWYKRDEQGSPSNSFSVQGNIGLTYRASRRDTYRTIRRHFGSDLMTIIPKHQRRNGKMVIGSITYLGRF